MTSSGSSRVAAIFWIQSLVRDESRRVIAALAEVDADGYVFRVDMRLRPNGR